MPSSHRNRGTHLHPTTPPEHSLPHAQGVPQVGGVQKGAGLCLWFHLRHHPELCPQHRAMATNAPAVLGG